MARDYYQTLGISRNADEKAIKNAYRKLARQYHPDVNPNNSSAEAKFKEISAAHEVLADPEKRKLYDQFGEDFEKIPPGYAQYGPQGGHRNPAGANFGGQVPPGMNFEDLLRQAQSQAAQNRGGASRPQGGGVGEVFSDIFGFGGQNRSRGPQKGGDVEQPVEISFAESIKGTQRRLNLRIQGDDGRSESRDVTVKIPAAIGDGQSIKVAGKGASGRGGPNGDLFLRIQVASDPFWKRDGQNIRVEIPVSFSEAALGAQIQVPTLNGEVGLKIPAGMQSGTTFRLSGRGVKNEKSGTSGDQFVTVKIGVPKDLSAREEELIKELATLRSETGRENLPKNI